MAKKFLVDIDLAKNSLNNARVQNLAADPSTPVVGQTYFNTSSNKLRTYNGTTWDEYSTGGGSGDVSQAAASGGAGRIKVSAGASKVITDYATAGIVKSDGSGVASAAVAGTDYLTGSSTNALTNKTFDANGTGNALSNVETADLAAGVLNISATLASASDTQVPSALAVKTYADNIANGRKWKDSVRAATAAAGTLASSFANASVIDGVTLATGDRILIKDQAAGAENGIYTVNATGAPTRAVDADTAVEIKQASVFVEEGTANADSQWVLTNDGTITLGTTALTFAYAGNNSIQSASTTVQGKVELATQAEAQAKTDTVRALTAASVADFSRKFTGTIGDGAAVSYAVTHGLGSQFVNAQAYEVSSGNLIECDITLTSATITTFAFAVAPASNAIRIVITG